MNGFPGESARSVADSAYAFVEGLGGVKRSRAKFREPLSLDKAVWQQMAELGWLLIGVPDSLGGVGMDEEEIAALFESLGRSLMPEPVGTSVAAAQLLADCHSEIAGQSLAELAAGRVCVVPRLAESPMENGMLTVPHVPDCFKGTRVLLGATSNGVFDIRLLEVDAPGVSVETRECVDGSPLSTLSISASAWEAAPMLEQGEKARVALYRARDTLLLTYSAYLVGLMGEVLRLTLEYLKIRKQFGVPIGSFQALQHRAVNCHIDVAACRALLYEACKAFRSQARPRAAAMAKARASAAALRVCKTCVQLHGAIGFTDEHDAGLYLKKAMVFAARDGGEMEQKLRLNINSI